MKIGGTLALAGAIALATACGGSDDSGGGGVGGTAAGGTGGAATGGSGGSGAGGAAGAATGGAAGSASGGVGGGTGGAGTGGGTGSGLASKYPGDVGIEKDPDVVWVENFEAGSVDAVVSRYEDAKNKTGMALLPDVPPKTSGKASLGLTAGGGKNATDFYKKLDPGYDELFVRYYAKYQGGVKWHHTGVWIGGYNPASNWPNPKAGLKPNGDDRFSVSLEPVGSGANPRMDFYNYWMKMHSWMDNPSGSTAYYGNTLVHQAGLTVKDDQWMCIELHVKLNPDPASGAGAELGVWMDGVSVQQFTDSAPLGYWLKDKFCPDGADSPSCTNYPPSPSTPKVPLDLQYRSTAALKLNAFWPQNYITDANVGVVQYDDMVVAKKYIGCLQ